jgi:hypothetical protein
MNILSHPSIFPQREGVAIKRSPVDLPVVTPTICTTSARLLTPQCHPVPAFLFSADGRMLKDTHHEDLINQTFSLLLFAGMITSMDSACIVDKSAGVDDDRS